MMMKVHRTKSEDEGVYRVKSQEGWDYLSMILVMPCRSAETLDKEVNYLDGPESSLGY